MPRDRRLLEAFTGADDAMQGLWGIHRYSVAASRIVPTGQVLREFPEKYFQMTHAWKRLYNKNELASSIQPVLDFVQSRLSLMGLVSVFEAVTGAFSLRLKKLGKISTNPQKYKNQLEWLFLQVRGTKAGSPGMLQRLPLTCGDIDNARRLRNSFPILNCYISRISRSKGNTSTLLRTTITGPRAKVLIGRESSAADQESTC